jgi:hypothetical protein
MLYKTAQTVCGRKAVNIQNPTLPKWLRIHWRNKSIHNWSSVMLTELVAASLDP